MVTMVPSGTAMRIARPRSGLRPGAWPSWWPGAAAGCSPMSSPSGGRHVFILFAAALPWLELRDVARALALRFPSIDTSPMSSLGGQI